MEVRSFVIFKTEFELIIIIYIIMFFVVMKIKIYFFCNLSQKISCFEILKPYLKPFVESFRDFKHSILNI